MSKDKKISLQENPELERYIHDILDTDIETLKNKNPALYEELQRDPNLNRLKRATGEERSSLTRWFIDKGIRKAFKGE